MSLAVHVLKSSRAGPTETLAEFRARRAAADKRWAKAQATTNSATQEARAAKRAAEWDQIEAEIAAKEGASASAGASKKTWVVFRTHFMVRF